jgi:hypothetical protein
MNAELVKPAEPSTFSYFSYVGSFFSSPPDDCDTAYNDAVKAAAETKKTCKANKTTTTTGGKAKKSKGGKAKKAKKSKKNQKK